MVFRDGKLIFATKFIVISIMHDIIIWQVAFAGLVVISITLILHIFIKRRIHQKLKKEIGELNAMIEDSNHTIKRLNGEIHHRMNSFSSRVKDGRMLFDHIENNGTTSLWKKQHYHLFNEYYESTHSEAVTKLKKGRTKKQLSPHNLFYLILKDMGKSDKEIRDIMGISPEALRTLRFRTKLR